MSAALLTREAEELKAQRNALLVAINEIVAVAAKDPCVTLEMPTWLAIEKAAELACGMAEAAS